MHRLNLIQGTDEWLDWRKTVVTATDASALQGISPYATAYKAYQNKLGLSEPKFISNAMLRGQIDEPIAREIFIKESGIFFEPCCIKSEVHDFLGASLDGISFDDQYILEIKSQNIMTIKKEGIPDFHNAQIQHQLMCTDGKSKKCFYVSYWDGEIYTLEIEPDLEWQKNYLPQAKYFWDCVFCQEPPELSCKDYKNMSGDFAWEVNAIDYKNICQEIKILEIKKEEIKNRLKEISNGESASGGGIKLLYKKTKGKVDYEAIEELKNIELDKYRKPNTFSWTVYMEKKF